MNNITKQNPVILLLILIFCSFPLKSIAQMDKQYNQQEYRNKLQNDFCNYAFNNYQFIRVDKFAGDPPFWAANERSSRTYIDRKSQVWTMYFGGKNCRYEGLLNKETRVGGCWVMFKIEGALLYKYYDCSNYRNRVNKNYWSYNKQNLSIGEDGMWRIK